MADTGGRNYIVFIVGSIYLIATFLWRLFVRGGEWPLSPGHYVSMLLTVVIAATLIAMRPRLMEGFAEEPSKQKTATTLFTLAMVAAVGSLLIRFTSTAAWWTGHLTN